MGWTGGGLVSKGILYLCVCMRKYISALIDHLGVRYSHRTMATGLYI